MSKQKISAKQVLSDINAGMSNSELMEKYGVSSKGLESIFKKLTDAGLLNEASLEQMPLSSKPDAIMPSGQASIPKTAPTIQPEQKSTDSLMRIAEDIKNGVHEGEIMRRYELSPGMLREIKEKLVQEGHLESNRIEHEDAKRTKICPFCSREIPQSAGKCSHCGEWVDTDPNSVARHRPAPMTESPEAPFAEDDDFEGEKECAWEERANYGTTKAFIKTATESLMRPTNFFSRLPLDGNYLDPILFAVMSGVMGIVLAYMWTSLFSGGLLGLVGLLFSMALVFVALLISLPLILLFWSALLHGSLFLVKGANEGFKTTFRVASYSSVTTLFNALPIPYLGNIASLWGLVLTVIGIRETHKTTTVKAAAAVLISVGVTLAILAIFFASIFTATFGGMKAVKAERASKIPAEVCIALQAFVDKVDSSEGSKDDEVAEAKIQEAGKELEEVLKQYSNDKEVRQLAGKAFAYQMGVFMQRQVARAAGSAQQNKLQDNLQRQRDELLACAASKKRK